MSDDGSSPRTAVAHTVLSAVVVTLLQVPHALRLTRRLRQEEQVQRGLAVRVEAARAEERERLAAHLREGVLQDLAAVGYVLDAVGADLPDPGTRDLILRASEVLRGDVTALRRLAHGDVPAPGAQA